MELQPRQLYHISSISVKITMPRYQARQIACASQTIQQAIPTARIGLASWMEYVLAPSWCTRLTYAQISELREHLDEIPTTAHARDDTSTEVPGPDILFGRQRHASKQELLAALPPKTEADQLISTYFASMDTSPSKTTVLQTGSHATAANRPRPGAQADILERGRCTAVMIRSWLTFNSSMPNSGINRSKHPPCGLAFCSPSSLWGRNSRQVSVIMELPFREAPHLRCSLRA